MIEHKYIATIRSFRWYAVTATPEGVRSGAMRVYLYREKGNSYRIAVRPRLMPFDQFEKNPQFVDEVYNKTSTAIEAALALANAMGLELFNNEAQGYDE